MSSATLEPETTDSQDLQRFGYRQELERSLGSFSAFAAGFSYISILTGLSQTFYLGYGAGGPAFFWTWPLVLLGHLMIALCFAELAAHYPLSGGVYQWARRLGSPFLGWMTGWVYLACLVVTLAAVALALQSSLPQLWPGFQLCGNLADPRSRALNAVVLGCLLLAASTLINSIGVGLLARINNAGVLSELAGVVALIVLLARRSVRGPAAAVLPTLSKGAAHAAGYPGAFLAAAALTASYVMYGYDTAGSLAEETRDPRRRAPRAILRALSAAGALGLLVLLFTLMAAPDLGAAELASPDGGLPYVVLRVLGRRLGGLLLCDVAFAIFVCALAVHGGAIRLVYSMARDGGLPFSAALSRVSGASRVPVLPVLLCGAGAGLILIVNVGFPNIVELVTAVAILWANLAYLLVVAALLKKRLEGWPSGEDGAAGRAAFSLGRLGLPVNVLALAWAAFMVINVGWPRAEIYGESTRHAAILYTAVLLLAGAAWRGLSAEPGDDGLAAPETAA